MHDIAAPWLASAAPDEAWRAMQCLPESKGNLMLALFGAFVGALAGPRNVIGRIARDMARNEMRAWAAKAVVADRLPVGPAWPQRGAGRA